MNYPPRGTKLTEVSNCRFTSRLHTVPAGEQHKLTRPFSVSFRFKNVRRESAAWGDQHLTVPAGFIMDFASVPGILKPAFPLKKMQRASVVHDWLFEAWKDEKRGPLKEDWRYANNLFHALLLISGVSRKTADLAYLGVETDTAWEFYRT